MVVIGLNSKILSGAEVNYLKNKFFNIKFNSKGITSISNPDDEHNMDFILQDENNYVDYSAIFREMGTIILRYNINGLEITFDPCDKTKQKQQKIEATRAQYICSESNVEISQTFELSGENLEWKIEINNLSDKLIEIEDLEIPLCFNTAYKRAWQETYLRRAIRHSFIAGDGSFIFLTKAGGDPPFLVMTPNKGTSINYFDTGNLHDSGRFEGYYSIFLHAALKNNNNINKQWRLPTPSKILNSGELVNYGFSFNWVNTYEDIRDILYENGLFDIRIVPGMTIPFNLDCKIAIRTKSKKLLIISEYPENTVISEKEKNNQHHIFSATFRKLGENMLTIENEYGDKTYLQFFVTESLETLINKRASFITTNQFYLDKGKWYDGLLGVWNMKNQSSPNPDNQQGLQDYVVSGGDDCFKAPLLARKNLIYPDDTQISVIEYYLENYVWGKHQRTDQESPYPYGIHGGENWFVNRNSENGFNSGGIGQDRIWRTFDYPHLILTYFRMHQIAKMYPDKCKYLSAEQYLDRAFGTAKAFFTVPISIEMKKPWDFNGYPTWAYTQGNFNEKIIPELIDRLSEEGRKNEAVWLKNEWEKKVKFFIYDHEFPFGSEMFFDATAFESTHAIAKYALSNQLEPDNKLWQNPNTLEWYSHPDINRNDFLDFMDRQMQGNITCRGWIETSFYQLGSDIRACGNSAYNLSYMSQLGGWAILDYGLYFSKDIYNYINLGYASILSSWALLNSGTQETNYGYWYPGIENDGAAGWAYEPKTFNKPWGVDPIERGIWNVDGEIDMGLGSSIDALCTIVTDDPIFGIICYGGNLEEEENEYVIYPLDGVRKKMHIRLGEHSLDIKLDRDQFSKEEPIRIKKDLKYIRFSMYNITNDIHCSLIRITGLKNEPYDIFANHEPGEITTQNENVHVKIAMKKDFNGILEMKKN